MLRTNDVHYISFIPDCLKEAPPTVWDSTPSFLKEPQIANKLSVVLFLVKKTTGSAGGNKKL